MSNLILYNANVITMDPANPKARSVAMEDGKILAVSGDDSIREFNTGDTKTIDCGGKTILPGFIDAHCHVQGLAESLVSINLATYDDTLSIHDIQEKIRKEAENLPPGDWIRVKGYHEFNIKEKRHPNRQDLDKAGDLHPIKMTHRSGHAHVLNSLALKCAGISIETPDPPGGFIDRDIRTGEPTGILYEMGDYLAKQIPPINPHVLEQGIKKSNHQLLLWKKEYGTQLYGFF
ncbi:amidohydrolase family protein [Thermodesulfobacteriota bacterium]